MTEKNKNLVLRITSALVLLPIAVYLVWRGGWGWCALLAFGAGAGASEYYQITLKRLSPAGWAGVALAALMPFLPPLVPGRAAESAFWLVGAFMIGVWMYHLQRAAKPGALQEAPVAVAHLTTGLIYVGVGFLALSALRLRPQDGFGWTLCALVATWANDTLAYFSGRLFGRTKFYREVSPNKTWEGWAGGMVGSIVGLLITRYFFPELTVRDCLVLGAAAGVVGPVADLVESLIKRAYGVKDSGRIIPGHGGMLDRVDALLFNAPLVYLYVRFIRDWLF